jgi:hypothetical protein
MPPTAIRLWLRQQPFRPFRFYVLEMTAFDVLHPEMMVIGLASLDIELPVANLASGQTHYRSTVALIHITRLEPLFVPPSLPNTNGEQ